jgi:hypothetical protein
MHHASHPPSSQHLTQAVRDCIAACQACEVACNDCFAHMATQGSDNDCPRCCIDCAALCRLTVDALSRNSGFAHDIARLCARACEWCAQNCGAHAGMAHCQACAEACRACAQACLVMSES